VLDVTASQFERDHHVVAWISLRGALVGFDQAEQISEAVTSIDEGTSIVVDLRSLTALSVAGVSGLRSVIGALIARNDHVVVVTDDVDHRARLVLGDVDTHVSQLQTSEQADAIIARAA
jgi:hypothetical protein